MSICGLTMISVILLSHPTAMYHRPKDNLRSRLIVVAWREKYGLAVRFENLVAVQEDKFALFVKQS
jgi:hypothetical protein